VVPAAANHQTTWHPSAVFQLKRERVVGADAVFPQTKASK